MGCCCSSLGLKRCFWDSQEGKDNQRENLGRAKIDWGSWRALGWIGELEKLTWAFLDAFLDAHDRWAIAAAALGLEGLKRCFWDSQEGKKLERKFGPCRNWGGKLKSTGMNWWAGKADLSSPWCWMWGVTVWKGTQQPCGFPKENQTLWTLLCTGKCGRSGTATNWVFLCGACWWNLIARLLLIKIKVSVRITLILTSLSSQIVCASFVAIDTHYVTSANCHSMFGEVWCNEERIQITSIPHHFALIVSGNQQNQIQLFCIKCTNNPWDQNHWLQSCRVSWLNPCF